jgi:LysM repeat protein
LAEANYLKTTARLTPGQKLMIPHEATVLMAAQAERSTSLPEARAVASEPARVASVVNSNRKVMYQVRRGDTLASIARAFKTSVSWLKTWNKLPGDQVSVGAKLTIYQDKKSSIGG